ncbi:MAG: CapA family protein [Clostridia bacterium]|nr:CapA family protein [Clostridia bacterium]
MGKTSIIFTGDIGFDKYMDGRWADERLFSKELLSFFSSADHTVANIEGAVIDPESAAASNDGKLCFHAMHPDAVNKLREIGADIWCIGNNHIMDAGTFGLESTLKTAEAMGCRTVGAGININDASAPIYLDEAGGIGIINVCYRVDNMMADEDTAGVFSWDDLESIAQRIKEIKARCRWCIVIAHGGEEFACLPNPYTRDRYMRYLELGADVIVGHHPHVPENYELFPDGKAIFYSLGNFIFDTDYQRVHLYTEAGVLLKLSFTEEAFDFEAVGIKIIRGDERIDIAPLPDIFTNIPADEYEKLSPLSAAAFVKEYKKTMIYISPVDFENASEELWNSFLFSNRTDGFDKGTHMDFFIIIPFSKKAESGEWKNSKLDKVKDYILKLL